MAPPDNRSGDGHGHSHTDNVELEHSLESELDDELDDEQQQPAVPNSSVAEAARRRRTVEKPEELEQQDLDLREYTDAVPPPPPPPQAPGAAGGRVGPRDMTTADEPDGDGDGSGAASATASGAAVDDDDSAIDGEEWTSRNGPPAPPESSRVVDANPWLSRE